MQSLKSRNFNLNDRNVLIEKSLEEKELKLEKYGETLGQWGVGNFLGGLPRGPFCRKQKQKINKPKKKKNHKVTFFATDSYKNQYSSFFSLLSPLPRPRRLIHRPHKQRHIRTNLRHTKQKSPINPILINHIRPRHKIR